MSQIQGNSSSSGGRIDGSLNKRAVVAADIALGAGWGGAATVTVLAGSTDQRGQCTITASTTTPAQATATVVLTFADGAYASLPFAQVTLQNSTSAITDQTAREVAVTTTALSWKSGVLPVDTKVYIYNWFVVA